MADLSYYRNVRKLFEYDECKDAQAQAEEIEETLRDIHDLLQEVKVENVCFKVSLIGRRNQIVCLECSSGIKL